MVQAPTNGLIIQPTKVPGSLISSMVRESTSGVMAVNIKASGKKI